MTRMARLALAVIVGVGGAGCGSSDAGERNASNADRTQSYESSVRAVHAEMNDAMAAAFASSSLDADRVRTAKETAQEAASRMEAAEIPEAYTRAHEEYLRGLETFVEILDDVEQQVDDPNVARRHLEDERFSSGVQHLERASQLYDDAGLDLDDDPSPGE